MGARKIEWTKSSMKLDGGGDGKLRRRDWWATEFGDRAGRASLDRYDAYYRVSLSIDAVQGGLTHKSIAYAYRRVPERKTALAILKAYKAEINNKLLRRAHRLGLIRKADLDAGLLPT